MRKATEKKEKVKKVVLPLFTPDGKSAGEVEVSDKLFAAEVNRSLLHGVAEAYLANLRQGTASTKTRAQVASSGRKLYRQKGTGRARAGVRVSPTRVGGGVAFGPSPRDYRKDIPKRLRRQALCAALSSRVEEGAVRVLEEVPLETISTKAFVEIMQALGLEAALTADRPRALLLVDRPDDALVLSARNIRGVVVGRAEDLNAYEVLKYDQLLLTRAGLQRLQEVFA